VWATEGERFAPDPAVVELYDELYGLYRQLYPATASQAHALAALQRRMNGREDDEAG
jgi:xylulokinase